MKTFFSFLILGCALSFALPMRAQQSHSTTPTPVIMAHPAIASTAAAPVPKTASSIQLTVKPVHPDSGPTGVATHAPMKHGTAAPASALGMVSAKPHPMPDFDARTVAIPQATPQHALPPSKLQPVGQLQPQGINK
jgi:hypothetical protein